MLRRLPVRIGAGIAYVLLYGLCPRWLLGPKATIWNTIRRRSFRVVGYLVGHVLHIDRPIRHSEFVGRIESPLNEVEQLLWERGFHRNPVAAVKTRNGVPEDGSWVRREHSTAQRQLHVIVFEARDEASGVDVYAHEEFSNVHPSVAVRHYRGIDQNERAGVKMALETLPIDKTR
jgi:hypothetical protein